MQFRGRKVVDIEVDGVDPRDYPDFCDAYVSRAFYDDTGEPLTESELEEFSEANSDVVGEIAFEQCIGMSSS
jgi:hypothetical protein